MNNDFDVVIAVGPRHVQTSLIVVKSLKMNGIGSGRFFFITRPTLFEGVDLPEHIELIDEGRLVEGLDFAAIKTYFDNRGIESDRHGWYLKQFLNLGIGLANITTPNYLVWDADTYALRPMSFIDEEDRFIFDLKTEHNKPYFDNIERVFGIKKQITESFISEHMIFNTEVVRELVRTVEERFSQQKWYFTFLDKIDDSYLHGPGFAEYETYGTFFAFFNKERFVKRTIPSVRYESPIFGRNLSGTAMFYLSNRFFWVTQEFHKKVSWWVSLKARLKMYFFVLLHLKKFARLRNASKAVA